jgi:pimeloyl-ACP methyl ester carboxylesterase
MTTRASAVPVTARTLAVPGARLYYEVRGQGTPVALVGAPMKASSFAPLADLLAAEHTVLTTDPRGINRSVVDERNRDSTPEMRADDLSRLLAHLDAGPAAVLGSSGGAVGALALAQAYSEQVHTVIAHEPAMDTMLDDHEQLQAQTGDIIATYQAGDIKGAWRKFLAQANVELPEPVFEEMFGHERDPQEAADQDFWFGHELRATNGWHPDIAALRNGSTRIVVGIGEQSAGQLCERTSTVLAAALDTEPVYFPGGHIGFTEDSGAFAERLRAVLRPS